MDIDRKSCVVAFPLFLASIVQVHGDESWQLKRLLDPDHQELIQESNGTVFIYDGLFDSDIEFALTDQFHRIESMMFIRTKSISDGEVEQEDDCS